MSSNMLRCGVIMAGGSGERFWPLSRKNRPKQLLRLNRPDKSMLEESVELAAGVIGLEHLYVITGIHLVEPIRAALPVLPQENILAEPSKRNTAGALSYAFARIMANYPDQNPDSITIAVTTADHRIGDAQLFKTTLQTAIKAAEEHKALVTCGITPTYPETGFGYIEFCPQTPVMLAEKGLPPIYKTLKFYEKPDLHRATQFLQDGRYLWNSGMFFWKLSVFLDEMEVARPDIRSAIDNLVDGIKNKVDTDIITAFNSIESTSIDYALMEKSKNVLVVKGDFSWVDVGSWNAIALPDACDERGNYRYGDPILIDCDQCIVYNEAGNDAMAVGVLGMKDVVVVTTSDAVLVIPRKRSQDVRKIVEELKRRNASQI